MRRKPLASHSEVGIECNAVVKLLFTGIACDLPNFPFYRSESNAADWSRCQFNRMLGVGLYNSYRFLPLQISINCYLEGRKQYKCVSMPVEMLIGTGIKYFLYSNGRFQFPILFDTFFFFYITLMQKNKFECIRNMGDIIKPMSDLFQAGSGQLADSET